MSQTYNGPELLAYVQLMSPMLRDPEQQKIHLYDALNPNVPIFEFFFFANV